MSTITLNIEEKQLALLRAKAQEANMSVEDFLREIVNGLLDAPDDKFEAAREYVRTRYKELYKKLA